MDEFENRVTKLLGTKINPEHVSPVLQLLVELSQPLNKYLVPKLHKTAIWFLAGSTTICLTLIIQQMDLISTFGSSVFKTTLALQVSSTIFGMYFLASSSLGSFIFELEKLTDNEKSKIRSLIAPIISEAEKKLAEMSLASRVGDSMFKAISEHKFFLAQVVCSFASIATLVVATLIR